MSYFVKINNNYFMFRDKIRSELFLEKSKSVLKGVSVELVIE